MKKILLTLALTLAFSAICLQSSAKTKKVAVFGVTLNSAIYSQAEKGFLESLTPLADKTAWKYVDVKSSVKSIPEKINNKADIQFDVYSADGDIVLGAAMAEKIKAGNYNAVLSFGTPATVLLRDSKIEKPVVFSIVLDPKAINVVNNYISTGTNYTGVSNNVSIKLKVGLLKELAPDAKRVGIVQNIGEDQITNSVKEILENKDLFGINEIIITQVDALKLSKEEATQVLAEAAKKLISQRVDAIFIFSGAVTGSEAAKGLIDVANAHKIPTLAYTEPPAELGATIGVFANTRNLGKETWPILDKILKGSKPSDISVYFQPIPEIIVNIKAANDAGIKVPDKILEKATKVIE